MVMFLFLLFIFTAVIYGIAGPYGLLVNQEITRIMEQEEHELSVKRVSLNNVQHRLDSSWTHEALLDNARMMGYVQPGEIIYFFYDKEGNPHPPSGLENSDRLSHLFIQKGFEKREISGLPFVFCLIFSLLASFGITGFVAFRTGKHRAAQVLEFNGGSHGNNLDQT